MKARQLIPLWLSGGTFLLLFMLLAPSVSNLRLYIDDFPYFFDSPRLISNFWQFAQGYLHTHGIYRPFAQLWYWVLYSIYAYSSSFAHLIPWAVQCASGALLMYVLLHHGLQPVFALLTSILITVFPYSVEQFGWLSATPGTIAYALFLIQLWILQKNRSYTTDLLYIALLSCISIFLYESTFFFPIALLYLVGKKWPHKKNTSIASFAMLSLLYGLFIASKVFVKGTDIRPIVDSFSGILQQWNSLWQAVASLFWGFSSYEMYWNSFGLSGLLYVFTNPYTLVLLIMCVLYVGRVIQDTQWQPLIQERSEWKFWLLCFVLSILPLVANKEFYFGFRSLYLPVSCLCISLAFLFQTILQKNGKSALIILACALSISWICIDITMLSQYNTQYSQDMTLSRSIVTAIQPYDPDTVLLTSKIHLDSRDTFLHADYLHSCFFYNWSAPGCLIGSGAKKMNIGITHADGRIEIPKLYSSWNEMRQHPHVAITIHSYTDITVDEISK